MTTRAQDKFAALAPGALEGSAAMVLEPEPLRRVSFGRIFAHEVTSAEALEQIASLIAARAGGYVVTPNVDHVVQAEDSPELTKAYAEASLSLVDGQPLMWLSQWIGQRLPEKISGSDFIPRLMERSAEKGWRVFFFGGAPGVGHRAAEVVRERHPAFQLAGVASPPLGFETDPVYCRQLLNRIRETRADLVVFALGCPKQELFMNRWRAELAPAVAIGGGATLDFIAGNIRRAPAWMSSNGLEWLYRLIQQPRRLAYRYLVRDPRILWIAVRMLLQSLSTRLPTACATGGLRFRSSRRRNRHR